MGTRNILRSLMSLFYVWYILKNPIYFHQSMNPYFCKCLQASASSLVRWFTLSLVPRYLVEVTEFKEPVLTDLLEPASATVDDSSVQLGMCTYASSSTFAILRVLVGSGVSCKTRADDFSNSDKLPLSAISAEGWWGWWSGVRLKRDLKIAESMYS